MPAISFQSVSKTYSSARGPFQALDGVSFDIQQGEFFGLLGPNGAGKTTLISILAGLSRPTAGRVTVLGHDVQVDYAPARRQLGVVPQELVFDPFFTVREALRIQSGYFGMKNNDAWLDELLESLGLADKAGSNMRQLSGGMKRRVLVAQALVHKPPVIVLDEPTAGVDVELRHDMWRMVRELRERGTTIILTTHYIEEAEDLADRVGVISKGELILVEEKKALMRKMGQKQLTLELTTPLAKLPKALAALGLTLAKEGRELVYAYDMQKPQHSIAEVLQAVTDAKVKFGDLHTEQSSLEDIFMGLVKQ